MSNPFPQVATAAHIAELIEKNPSAAAEVVSQIGAKQARKLLALGKHYPEVFDPAPSLPPLRESVDTLERCFQNIDTLGVAESLAGIILRELDYDEALLTHLARILSKKLVSMSGHRFDEGEAGDLQDALRTLHNSILIE